MGVVILAAGASSRMGRPKMLLRWGETTILGHALKVWREAAARQAAVVMAVGDTGIAAELDRIGFPREDRIINFEPTRGMFSSIQCAAQWKGWDDSLTHFAMALGDQPHLQMTTLRALVEFSARNRDKVCQPAFRGAARHPVILPHAIFERLAQAAEPTLRDFLHAIPDKIARLDLNDAGLDLDIDRPEDYEKALRHVELDCSQARKGVRGRDA